MEKCLPIYCKSLFLKYFVSFCWPVGGNLTNSNHYEISSAGEMVDDEGGGEDGRGYWTRGYGMRFNSSRP